MYMVARIKIAYNERELLNAQATMNFQVALEQFQNDPLLPFMALLLLSI